MVKGRVRRRHIAALADGYQPHTAALVDGALHILVQEGQILAFLQAANVQEVGPVVSRRRRDLRNRCDGHPLAQHGRATQVHSGRSDRQLRLFGRVKRHAPDTLETRANRLQIGVDLVVQARPPDHAVGSQVNRRVEQRGDIGQRHQHVILRGMRGHVVVQRLAARAAVDPGVLHGRVAIAAANQRRVVAHIGCTIPRIDWKAPHRDAVEKGRTGFGRVRPRLVAFSAGRPHLDRPAAPGSLLGHAARLAFGSADHVRAVPRHENCQLHDRSACACRSASSSARNATIWRACT